MPLRWLTRSWVLILLTVALIGLSFAARSTPYFDFDLIIARAVQSIQVPGFDALMRAVGLPGYPPQVYVETVAIVVILFLIGMRWEAVSFVFATLGIAVIGLGLKLWVDRPRPSPNLIQVWNPGLDGGKLSYTAGHVQSYVAMLGFIAFLLLLQARRQIWQNVLLVVIAIMIALIGVSRVDSGEHWFSDVVGGYLFGFIWLGITIRFYEWGKSKHYGEQQKAPEKIEQAVETGAGGP